MLPITNFWRTPVYDPETGSEFEFERIEITLKDGEIIPIHAYRIENSKGSIILVPGVNGTSKEQYVSCVTNEALAKGYSVYVINHRGLETKELKTPVWFGTGRWEDVKESTEWISENMEKGKPLFVVGLSMGAV